MTWLDVLTGWVVIASCVFWVRFVKNRRPLLPSILDSVVWPLVIVDSVVSEKHVRRACVLLIWHSEHGIVHLYCVEPETQDQFNFLLGFIGYRVNDPMLPDRMRIAFTSLQLHLATCRPVDWDSLLTGREYVVVQTGWIRLGSRHERIVSI